MAAQPTEQSGRWLSVAEESGKPAHLLGEDSEFADVCHVPRRNPLPGGSAWITLDSLAVETALRRPPKDLNPNECLAKLAADGEAFAQSFIWVNNGEDTRPDKVFRGQRESQIAMGFLAGSRTTVKPETPSSFVPGFRFMRRCQIAHLHQSLDLGQCRSTAIATTHMTYPIVARSMVKPCVKKEPQEKRSAQKQ